MLDIQTVASRIDYYLQLRGISAYKLAILSGVPGPTISRICSGTHKGVELKTLMPLAKALGVTTAHLTGELGVDDAEAVAAVRSNPKIAAAAIMMNHMDEPTCEQYVKIGAALAEPTENKIAQ